MRSLLHAHKPESRTLAQALEVETHSVVLYYQQQNVSIFCKLHLDLTGLRMAGDV
jgi:hypothetical protein